jgi:hypothetical protein
MLTDRKSFITYGYDGKDLPIYFNQDPVFTTGMGNFAAAFSGRGTQTYGCSGCSARQRAYRSVCAAAFLAVANTGTCFLGFNAILNWNNLDAGTPEPKGERTATSEVQKHST